MPLLTPKIKIWKKCKKHLKILSLHMCTITQDHMMYGSWDIKCKGQSFCHFGPFLPFDPPNNPKNQNLEKIKKHLEILSFYFSVTQMMIIWSMVPEISSTTDRIFSHFGPFFALFYLLTPTTQRIKVFKKWKKNTWRYHHLTQVP